jgi:LuxR family quorum-sensing transcriptional regulator LasR
MTIHSHHPQIDQSGAAHSFLSDLDGCTDCMAVLAVLTKAARPFGMECIALGEVQVAGASGLRPFFYTNWPARWREIYVESGLGGDDPLLKIARTTHLPFSWNSIRGDSGRWGLLPSDLTILNSLRGEFGWENGLAVPIHGPYDALGLVSYVGKCPPCSPDDVAALMLMAHHGYARMHRLHGEHSGGGAGHDGASAPLSQREAEALTLLAKGMTDREIAAHLGVAERTALYYVQSARAKLGCRTRAHLIAEASARGLLAV